MTGTRLRLMALAWLASGCVGATAGSGVGDRLLERPPWQAGARGPAIEPVGSFPVVFQAGAAGDALFEPRGGRGSSIDRLIAELNAAVADRRGIRLLATGTELRGTPPDVSFGCETDATGDCRPWDVGQPVLRLAVGRPSASWVEWAAAAMSEAGVDNALVLTLEIGRYLPRQRDLLGRKDVRLGRDHTVSLPWLTSLETPVAVLQLTGALVNREGRAIRIAAEGLLVRRTDLLASSVGLERLITDEEVEQARTARREDLPGRPLVWQVALENLVTLLVSGA